MKITKIKIKNFRILVDSELELNDKLSILIGKNNSGKTSFMVLFHKFYDSGKVQFDDFPLHLREHILGINENTDEHSLAIRLMMQIDYFPDDNLENISEFITNLKDEKTTVKFGFEYIIDKKKILEKLKPFTDNEGKKNFIRKNLGNFIDSEINIFNDESDFESANRHKLVKKDLQDVKDLINFQLIHAKRNVASSEEISDSKRVLSKLTTSYFNSKNEIDNSSVSDLNNALGDLDSKLNINYRTFFEPFLRKAKSVLDLHNLKVVSDLRSQEIVKHTSKVVYGEDNTETLPEHLNGLGYMNILYLLLNIEICKEKFNVDKKDINLFFIEEPEAHTHPQMQYIFAREIKNILEGIDNLQTLITTHSSHVVSQSDFKDIKYFQRVTIEIDKNLKFENIHIKNFDAEMNKLYSSNEEKEQLCFIKQYLNLQSSEMFFATKVIFIEGISEKILIYLFMRYHDELLANIINKEKKEADLNKRDPDLKITERENEMLLSQNITILESGANAKAFKHFLNFLDVRTLIITDIDTIDINLNGKRAPVSTGNSTSNATLKDYFNWNNDAENSVKKNWFEDLVKNKHKSNIANLQISFQTEENGYHARSFEDAFVSINVEKIIELKDKLWGLKCKDKLSKDEKDFYKMVYGESNANKTSLVGGVLDKKSQFASSILYEALLKEEPIWNVPKYIKEGLEWLAK